ncbi:MAG: hypothetical protein ACYDER_18040 [Ktedonobacteraceae bacterium]
MGQYQQWLHYRDVDRLLHTQLEELTEELAQLRDREQLLQQMLHPIRAQEQSAIEEAPSLLQTNNEILHALTIGLNGHTNNTNNTNHTEFTPSTNGTETTAIQSARQGEPTAAISQALFAQGSLLPTDEQFALDSIAATDSLQPMFNRDSTLPPIPHSPHPELRLLPEDMGAFIDEHTQTEPRMQLPWWLRNAALLNANGPIDQESIRTNRLIQRWIERWGRHPDAQELPAEESEHTANGENTEAPS